MAATSASTAPVEIEGVVERIIFRSDKTGYCVALLNSKTGPVSIVGTIPNLGEEETVRCRGRWVNHPKYGRQLQVESVITSLPYTESGIINYLASLKIPGLGMGTAQKIVNRFGLETFDVLDNHCERLDELKQDKISQKLIQTLRQRWREMSTTKEAVTFFRSHGIGLKTALRILKEQPNAAAIARDNPYFLVNLKQARVGFKTADRIAKHLGWPDHAPERIQAGIVHVIKNNLESGNTLMTLSLFQNAIVDLLKVPANIVAPVLKQMLEDQVVSQVVVDGNKYLTLPVIYGTEKRIAKDLQRILYTRSQGKLPLHCDINNLEQRIQKAEAKYGIRLEAQQREAVRTALMHKCAVITGGPGVGKTTITKILLEVIRQAVPQARLSLCAPTGKAARRMGETTGTDAKTIHRLLEFKGETGQFQRNRDNPLEADVVIVDEASMIDVFLAKDLFSAVPDGASLIIIGDVDQLPSVGPGQVLADIIRAGVVPVVRLTEVYRQAADSAIIRTAHRINRKQLPEKQLAKGGDFRFFKTGGSEETCETLQVLVQAMQRLLEKQGKEPEVQVLCPIKRGLLGTENLNRVLKSILNPNPPASVSVGPKSDPTVFSVGDRVIQTVNNYRKEVFNGTTGIIVDVDTSSRSGNTLVVDYDGRMVPYAREELNGNELALAYAISIHKSQGSEYSGVIIPIDPSQTFMLDKKLLYTGVTRAKNLCFMVGSPKTLAIAVRKQGADTRLTALCQAFEEVLSDSKNGKKTVAVLG